MQSGKLQHLLTIERKLESQSDDGDDTETWEPLSGFTRIFGEVLPDRAGEFFQAQQLQATRNALIRLYYQPGINEKMRVVHHVRPDFDEYWDIAGCVHFQSRQRELRLMCIWREAEGWRRGTDLLNGTADEDDGVTAGALLTEDGQELTTEDGQPLIGE